MRFSVWISSNSYKRWPKISDSGLHTIIQALGKLSSLRNLTLDFSKSHYTNKNSSSKLLFRSPQITDAAAFKSIGHDWKLLQSIEDISLTFLK